MVTRWITKQPEPPRGRLQFWSEEGSELTSSQLAAMAIEVGREVRRICGEKGLSVLQIFCSAPVEFAVLVGHQLTGMDLDSRAPGGQLRKRRYQLLPVEKDAVMRRA